MKNRKVLVFIDWYLPGLNAGGPVRTCANMVERLNDEFDFRIATRNIDLKAQRPYNNITSNAWNEREDKSQVYYFSDDQLSIKNIKKLIAETQPDVIHLNSLFSWYFTILPLIAARQLKSNIKVVVGPRGMLSKGALAIKPIKKKLFLAVVKSTGLFNGVTWHASTPIEANEIKNMFGSEVTVQLGIDLAPLNSIVRKKRVKQPGTANFFYLGRISPVKNLMQCLKALNALPENSIVTFDIYGPVEDQEYWDQCQDLMSKLPASVNVTYKGLIAHEQLNETISNYHFLLLLSENENYGHAIVESLVCGCPVIISDRTPWRNLESSHAGWDISLESAHEINTVLGKAIGMDQATYDKWSESAYEKGSAISDNMASVADNKNLFR